MKTQVALQMQDQLLGVEATEKDKKQKTHGRAGSWAEGEAQAGRKQLERED